MQENNNTNDTNSERTNSETKLLNRDNDKNTYKKFDAPCVGKHGWVIVGGDGIIINKNPTKEELKTSIKWTFKHNSTETCYRCGESFDEVMGHPIKEKDTEGKWLGIWDCANCWDKYSSNSSHKKLKLEADCRNGNLDPNSNHGIGYVTAVLVKKFLGIEDCFDITDNFCYPKYDMIEHKDWGKIDAKGSSLFLQNNATNTLYHTFRTNRNKNADFFFCIGYDKERKHVITVLIVPNQNNISNLAAMTVYYNRYSKYDKLKESKEEVKKWDDLFHTLKLDNCPVLRKNKQ